MWIEIVLSLAVLPVNLHKVRSVHHVPLVVDIICEDRTFVYPCSEVFNRCRPHADVRTAVASESEVVRSDDVSAVLARIVRVFENARFTVWKVLPKREVRVTGTDHRLHCLSTSCCKCTGCCQSKNDSFHVIIG